MIYFKKNNKYFKIFTNNLKDEIEEQIISDLLIENYKLHKKDEFDYKKFYELFVQKEVKNDFCKYNFIDICGQTVMVLEIPSFLMVDLRNNVKVKEIKENQQ